MGEYAYRTRVSLDQALGGTTGLKAPELVGLIMNRGSRVLQI